MIGHPLFATPWKMSPHSFGEDQKPDSGEWQKSNLGQISPTHVPLTTLWNNQSWKHLNLAYWKEGRGKKYRRKSHPMQMLQFKVIYS